MSPPAASREGAFPPDLRHRSRIRAVSDAWRAFPYLGHGRLEISAREIAECLRVTVSSASQMLEDGKGMADRAGVSILNN